MAFLLLLTAGFIGLVAHWLKRWARGQTVSSFWHYMSTHKRHSVASVMSLFAATVAMFTAGDIELTNQSLATAFLAGYAIDSTVNKAADG
jgi:hypothetical protein